MKHLSCELSLHVCIDNGLRRICSSNAEAAKYLARQNSNENLYGAQPPSAAGEIWHGKAFTE